MLMEEGEEEKEEQEGVVYICKGERCNVEAAWVAPSECEVFELATSITSNLLWS
jgi:hypothetical protein